MMLKKVFDVASSIRVIEENLPLMPQCNNDFSQAICKLVLHLARKEIEGEVKVGVEPEFKPPPSTIKKIPPHFVPLIHFCDKWNWAINTIRGLISRSPYDAYRLPSVSIHNPTSKKKIKWFVDEKKLHRIMVEYGESYHIRLHATRNLNIISNLKNLGSKKGN